MYALFYGDETFLGLFSTKEKAAEFGELQIDIMDDDPDEYYIKKLVLDSPNADCTVWSNDEW